jgi:hypothetical protein
MATNGKGTGIVGYNGKKGRSAWRIRSASGRRGRGVEFAPDSLLEGDGFELPVREHRAMAPSHGFAAASQRKAALRGAPASHGETAFRGAAGFCEARRAMRSTHREMRCSAAVQAARYRARGAPPCGPPIAKSGRAKT